jgi:hypothetical protein
MYPPDPNPPGYQRQIYQVGEPPLGSSGDRGGQIVPTIRSLAPATTPPGWGQAENNSRIITSTSAFLTRSSGEYDSFATSSYEPPDHVLDWWEGDRQREHPTFYYASVE